MQNILNIESGRFNLLHGEFYQKAFIKLYCSALRIDNKKLVPYLSSLIRKKAITIKDNK